MAPVHTNRSTIRSHAVAVQAVSICSCSHSPGQKPTLRFSSVSSSSVILYKANLFLCLAWRRIQEWYYSSPIITSVLDRGELAASSPCRFTAEESPRYPLYRKLGGTQSRSGQYRREKNLFPLQQIEPQSFSPQPVAIATELSRLCSLVYVNRII
jgi:hypothetical protein